MTAIRYLPPGALDSGRLQGVVREVVAAWAGRWLQVPAGLAVSVLAGGPAWPATAAPLEPDDLLLADPGGRAGLVCRAASAHALIQAVLGVALPAARLVAADRDLLEAVTGEALQGLAAALGARLAPLPALTHPGPLNAGPPASARPDTATGLRIDWHSEGPLSLAGTVDLHTDPDLLASLRLAVIDRDPGQDLQARPPGRLLDAVTTSAVRIGALAGSARIAAADLAGLRAGDVLVLDHAIDRGLPLTVNGLIVRDLSCEPVIEPDAPARLRLLPTGAVP